MAQATEKNPAERVKHLEREENGMVYIGSDDDRLYTFDATCRSACSPLWTYATLVKLQPSETILRVGNNLDAANV